MSAPTPDRVTPDAGTARWTRLVPFDELPPGLLAAWQDWRAAATAPGLDSPYFHPAFAAAVHAVHGGVAVAVAEAAGRPVGVFPLQLPTVPGAGPRARLASAVGRLTALAQPVGRPGADFQGPVLAPGAAPDPAALPALAGVAGIAFDHLLDPAGTFAAHVDSVRPSPLVDVTGGLAAYLGRASGSGRNKMSQARRMAARAGRELGPVRFEPASDDPALLDRVIELKRAQYAATGRPDHFAQSWRRELLHRLLKTDEDGFAGMLSVVMAGDELVAAHFGLRDRHVLHWWFPVYERRHASLAPGYQLLRELIGVSPEFGLRRIDLGRGEDDYKSRVMTGSLQVAQGLVTSARWRRQARTAAHAAAASVRRSALAPVARAALARARRLTQTSQLNRGARG
jgi:CelD/BcsL family acetyltransferase involved in cellulose biosynthesis